MEWLYKIGMLLNLLVLIYAFSQYNRSGLHNTGVILSVLLLIAILVGAYLLKNQAGRLLMALLVLYLPLIPVFFYFLFIWLMVNDKPDFK